MTSKTEEKADGTDWTLTVTCPDCGDRANIIGGYNAIDYISCTCGFYGKHYIEDGVVHTCRVPVVDGMRAEATDYKRRPAVEADYTLIDRERMRQQHLDASDGGPASPDW